MANASDDAEGTETERRKCTLSLMTIRYLEALSRRGTHGRGVSKVMTRLIEDGIQQAIEKGYIQLMDEPNPPEPGAS
jgi:hypothetical protein